MSRIQKILLSGVLVVGAYLGMKVLVGTQVAGYLDDVSARLAANEYLQVNRMDYEYGLFSGRLDYDVVYRPSADSAEQLLLAGLRNEDSLNLTGSMDVVHGPWLPGTGFGLAQGEIEIALPQQLRAALPDYPAGEAMVTIQVVSGFGGGTTLDARVTDYDGRLGGAGEPVSGELTLAGLRAEATVSASLDAVEGRSALERLRLWEPQTGIEFEVSDVESAVDLRHVLPRVWAGHSSLTLGRVMQAEGEESFRVDGLAMEASLGKKDEWLDSRMSLDYDSLQVSDIALGPGRFEASLEHIDARAYSDLMVMANLESFRQSGVNTPGFSSVLERLLAAGPALDIRKAAISLASEYDTGGQVRIDYEGPGRLSRLDLDRLSRVLTAEAGVSTTRDALEWIADTVLAVELPRASPSERSEEADRLVGEWVATMTSLGFQLDDQGKLSYDLALLDGQLTVNGEPSGIEQLASELINAGSFLTSSSSPAAPAAPAASAPAPSVQRGTGIALASGFLPDPHSVTVTAGGNEAAADRFGNHCSGYTTVDDANVTLQYKADSFPLYVSATSSSDTTLIVMSPDGTYHCNDDATGLNPALSFEDPATGAYRIWVGTYQPTQASAVLSISELAP